MSINHRNLSRLYVILIGSVVLFTLMSQLILQYGLKQKEMDSRLINLAGRQRMLSQKLTKNALLIQNKQKPDAQYLEDLEQWNAVHIALQYGSDKLNIPASEDPRINQSLASLSPLQKELYTSFQDYFLDPQQATLDQILRLEKPFLEKMDATVLAFEITSRDKLDQLVLLEFISWCIALLILLLEVLFIFRPSLEALRLEKERMEKISFIYAHTLRAPLTNIMSLVDLMEKAKRPEEKESYLKLLKETVQGFDQTVHDVIELSKKTHGG